MFRVLTAANPESDSRDGFLQGLAAGQKGPLTVDAGVVSLPHPDKPNLRGEDAHFVAANGLFLGICP